MGWPWPLACKVHSGALGGKNCRKMTEKRPEKKRDESLIFKVYTAHFERIMVEKWYLLREKTKRKWRFQNEKYARAKRV
jgi:hypothetical protein